MISVTPDLSWLSSNDSQSVVKYADGDLAWSHYDAFLRDLIESRSLKSICEIGGGANPTFPMSYVAERQLDYLILDISQSELDKAPAGYRKAQADIVQGTPEGIGGFDLAFSKMLAEHVSDGQRFHQNVAALLRPGGLAVHFFPTLYAPPFVLNAVLPERLAEGVLHLIQSGRQRSGRRAKFPAHYSWCRGPSQSQIKRFESLGFSVERYIGFFGHAGYYKKLPPLERAHKGISAWLVEHPIPLLTSFAWVVLRKEGA